MKTGSYKEPYDKVPVVIQVEDDDAEGLEKVICGECGSKMKHIKVLDYFTFGCNKCLKDVDRCSTKSVRADKIKAAFVTMMNKLTFSREQILKTYRRNIYLMEKENFLDEIS